MLSDPATCHPGADTCSCAGSGTHAHSARAHENCGSLGLGARKGPFLKAFTGEKLHGPKECALFSLIKHSCNMHQCNVLVSWGDDK